MEAVYAQVDDGAFTDLYNLVFDIFGCFGYDLLNAGRVNAAVLHETVLALAVVGIKKACPCGCQERAR